MLSLPLPYPLLPPPPSTPQTPAATDIVREDSVRSPGQPQDSGPSEGRVLPQPQARQGGHAGRHCTGTLYILY